MKFSLRQIEIFLEVARQQSISRAVRSLYMSQSAASEALATLEKAYGVALFDRVGRRLVLNDAGKQVRQEAEALINAATELDTALSGQRYAGHLQVGASFTIGNHLATRCMANYLESYPEARVGLHIANTPEIVDKVLNREVDVGMIESEVVHPDVELIPWRRDSLVVFCAAGHPLAQRPQLSEGDICDVPWILRERDSGARQTFDRAMARWIPKMHIYLQLRHNEAIKTAVEAGLGVGCLSQIVLRRNFATGDLHPLHIPEVDLQRTFYFVLPRGTTQNQPLKTWMKACHQLSETLSAEMQ